MLEHGHKNMKAHELNYYINVKWYKKSSDIQINHFF